MRVVRHFDFVDTAEGAGSERLGSRVEVALDGVLDVTQCERRAVVVGECTLRDRKGDREVVDNFPLLGDARRDLELRVVVHDIVEDAVEPVVVVASA